METRGRHFLIGMTVLIFVAAFFAMAIWLTRADFDEKIHTFRISFQGSVTGLGIGGDVRYRGIRVGEVVDISIDPADPARVQTLVEIDGSVPIRQGDVAKLTAQGITGLAFINIQGALAKNAPLTPVQGQEYAEIPSQASDLEKLFSDTPQLINRAILVAERLADFLGQDNQQNVQNILADVSAITRALADQQGRIDRVLAALEGASSDVSKTLASARNVADRSVTLVDEAGKTMRGVRQAAGTFNSVMGRDVKTLVAELRASNRDLKKLLGSASGLVGDNSSAIEDFATDGLGDVRRLVTEARLLVASMQRVMERLETGGAQSLLGLEGAEVKAE